MVKITRPYNGEDRVFAVVDPLLFERILPTRSIYQMLQRFTEGVWTIDDVAVVISYALHGPTISLQREWDLTKRFLAIGDVRDYLANRQPMGMRYHPHPAVVDVVTTAPATYAPIAADLLTELLFGPGSADEASTIDGGDDAKT